MPLPTVITDLNAVIASNSPAGADTPSLGDDYLRAHGAFIRQVYDADLLKVSATTLADTTSAANGAGMVGWIRAAASAVATTVKGWIDWQSIHVFEFMTVAQIASVQARDNVQDVTAPLTAAIAACGSTKKLKLADGLYKHTGLTVTKALTIEGEGVNTILRCVGAGADCLYIDGTGVTNGLAGGYIRYLTLATEAGGGDALKMRFTENWNVEGVHIPSAAVAAVRLLGSAYATFTGCTTNQNFPYTAGTRAVPQFGISLEVNPVNSVASGHCNFIGFEVLGASSGSGYAVQLADTTAHCNFVGGSFVGANYGVVVAAGAQLNNFSGCVLEENLTLDWQVNGAMNNFVGCQGMSIALSGAAGGIVCTSGAYANNFIGGRYRNITINSGVLGTIIKGCALFTGVTDNGTGTQIESLWEITSAKYLPIKIRIPSTPSSSGGQVSVTDSANNNRRFSYGVDSTIYANGSGYVQTVVDGTATIPFLLNPDGGNAAIGKPTVLWGGTNNLAFAIGTDPALNHAGITLYTTDGLVPKFMDKNGNIRSITFT